MSPGFDPKAFDRRSRASWDQAAPAYAGLARRLFRDTTRAFADFARFERGSRVLDLACGPGTATRLVAERVGPRGRVTGADFSARMLSVARSRPAAKGAAPIAWRRADAQRLPFKSGNFDAVHCQLGLMLFARPAKALSEMARVVRPGGRVSVLVQGRAERMLFTAPLMRALARRIPELKLPGAPSLFAFGPPGVLPEALRGAGLVRVSARRLGGTFRFPSLEAYWKAMTRGAGRTGQALKSLPPPERAAVKAEVLGKLSRYRGPGGPRIPFEFVLARGVKPGA